MAEKKIDKFEEWDDFVKNKLPEFDIEKGSAYEAKLYLAYNEMRDIFTQKEYRLKYKIEILTKALGEIKDYDNNDHLDVVGIELQKIAREALAEIKEGK